MPQFEKGQSGNPEGRPKDAKSPLTKARTMILTIFEDNEEAFKRELKILIKEDPIKYYHEFVVPFMPKEFIIENEHSGEISHHHHKLFDMPVVNNDTT